MRTKGFTLIELMIVVAIIAIIAAIAIPGLLRARMSSNEGSAGAGLRSLTSAQATFVKQQSVNQDIDGFGENGLFNELTGASNRRGSTAAGQPASRPALTGITDMSVALSSTATNYASKNGYYWQLWVPGALGGAAITDNGVGDGGAQGIPQILDQGNANEASGIQQQENRWICYAWPATYRSSGIRAFVCDQSADVYACSNTDNTNNGYFFGDLPANRPNFATAMRNVPVPPNATEWTPIAVKDNINAFDPNYIWVSAG